MGDVLQHLLFDPSVAPELEPDSYVPPADTVAWRSAQNGRVVVEIYRRSNGTYGCRYTVWVAWRDAGGNVRDHAWFTKEPYGLVVDRIDLAQALTETHARSNGVDLDPEWNSTSLGAA